MSKDTFEFVDVAQLRIGLFVDLDVGWLAHPFASSAFKISSARQIEQLRALGLPRIRCVPARSDPPEAAASADSPADAGGPEPSTPAQAAEALDPRAARLREQRLALERSEQWFVQSAQGYGRMVSLIDTHPAAAVEQGRAVAQALVGDLLASRDSAVRLLTAVAGDRAALHPVNVTVLSLLLGRALSLPELSLEDLGLAALLHDVGKLQLPERVRTPDHALSAAELRLYQSHTSMGADWARQHGLGEDIVQAIAQHHEMADGSGFPVGLQQPQIHILAQILALTNRYDGLCNPARASAALTPHEALSQLFAQQKSRFDARVLSAFIRLMGVYPPGSVVQLVDDRYAMVVSVNAERPLKPRVLVHDPAVPRAEALVLDLDSIPQMGIRRSFKPSVLPSEAFSYLAPRQRACYYWETLRSPRAGAQALPA